MFCHPKCIKDGECMFHAVVVNCVLPLTAIVVVVVVVVVVSYKYNTNCATKQRVSI